MNCPAISPPGSVYAPRPGSVNGRSQESEVRSQETRRNGAGPTTPPSDSGLPKADGKVPVLIARTPDTKAGGGEFAFKAGARNPIGIITDVRGSGTSEAKWYTCRRFAQVG